MDEIGVRGHNDSSSSLIMEDQCAHNHVGNYRQSDALIHASIKRLLRCAYACARGWGQNIRHSTPSQSHSHYGDPRRKIHAY